MTMIWPAHPSIQPLPPLDLLRPRDREVQGQEVLTKVLPVVKMMGRPRSTVHVHPPPHLVDPPPPPRYPTPTAMPRPPRAPHHDPLPTSKHKRLEFNAGDIGIAGGIQMREAANLNPTTVDMIKRFGGSTSQDIQWPEDEADGDGDDRFERMEKLIQKALQRVTKSSSKKGHGSTGGGDEDA